jgi:hypothetical protein
MADDRQDIEAQRRQLHAAERKARAAYAKEAPIGMRPLPATPIRNGPPARRLKELQDKVQAAEAARKAFDEEHPI